MKEIWKDIRDYEGLYQVSNLGRVKSLGNNKTKKEKILKPSVNKKGYLYVGLCKNRKVKYFRVHRLVAQAFIPNPNNLPFINHKSEIKTQNNVENLEWCDQKYNVNYGTAMERLRKKNTNNPSISKVVLQIDKNTNKVIAEFPSLREVKRLFGYKPQNIGACCNNKPHHNTAYGFKWKYK